MHVLLSLYLLEFIVVSNFIQLECIYSICISTVFIGNYCGLYFYLSGSYLFQIYLYYINWTYIYPFIINLLIFIGLDLLFFYSIHVL